jgi:V/A-type H+-transporting ATPase subunit E
VNQVIELEKAILARAQHLVGQYAEQGQRLRESMLREANERVRQREQREEAIARALGDRHYRQQVQATELRLQSTLDRVRWNLVRAVEARLEERMRGLIADSPAYLNYLRALLREGVNQFEVETVRITSNSRDAELLQAHWSEIQAEIPFKTLEFDSTPLATLAGVILQTPDGRIRVDHSFEGRMERLRLRLQQVILEHLLPASLESTAQTIG